MSTQIEILPNSAGTDRSGKVPTGATTVASPRRLYLIGETDRSTPRPALAVGRISIQINGRWHAMRSKTATFEQLLRIAFPNRALTQPGAATVTFRQGAVGQPTGMLAPGDTIPLNDGLLVNANVTYAS